MTKLVCGESVSITVFYRENLPLLLDLFIGKQVLFFSQKTVLIIYPYDYIDFFNQPQ